MREAAWHSVRRREGAAGRLSLRWCGVFAGGGVALAWGVALWMLWPEWDVNAQYEYGKVVPILVAYLCLDRWRTRPERRVAQRERTSLSPEVSDSVKRRRHSPSPLWKAGLAGIIGAVTGLAMFLHEANPEWRLLGAMATLAATSLTVLLLHEAGGWRWVRHFSFPLLLFWVAVPMPRGWELSLMGHLMQTNAMLAAELARWSGVEATASGSVIRLAQCAVGVDEACSGIRSLNGSVMVALFLGEWCSLRLGRRIWLVVAAVGFALITNLGRTLLLVRLADAEGLETMEQWHDPAGLSVLVVCLAGIAGMAWLLRSKVTRGRTGRPQPRGDRAGQLTPLKSKGALHSLALRQAGLGAAFSAMLLGSVVGVQQWYGGMSRPTGTAHGKDWTVRFPDDAPGYREASISRNVESLLRFDHGESARWKDEAGRRWEGFYFRWSEGRSSHHDLLVHDPAICMSRLGMTMERDLGMMMTEQDLPVRGYVFRQEQERVYVFNSLDDEGVTEAADSMSAGDVTWARRWQAAVEGKRSETKRRLVLGVWGLRDDAEAREALQGFLTRCWHEWRGYWPASRSPHS